MAGTKDRLKYRAGTKGKRSMVLLVLGLLLAILLVACGGDANTLTLPTPQANSAVVPFETPPGTTATAPTTTIAPTTEPTVTLEPTVTPEPPTATAAPPTSTPAPTTTPTPPPAPPLTQPVTTPATPSNATATLVEAGTELKVIKTAYDALVKNYYAQPDTALIAQKALQEAAVVLGVSPPVAGGVFWGTEAGGNWRLFEQQFTELVNSSTLQLPAREVAHRVVSAMALATGDLHTYFLDEKRTELVNRQARGDNSTVGFGLSFIFDRNAYYVQRLITGAPAQQAGLKVGDKIVQFDGGSLTQANYSRLAASTENNSYKFLVERPNTPQPVELSIEFKRYKVPTVETQMLKNNVGFITINAFHRDVAERLDDGIAEVRKQGAQSLIIDLRFNGGGYNFQKVAGRFVKDGEPLGKFVNRGGTSPLKAESNNKLVDPPLPLVVLIDRNSASASEVFSLAVRDYKVGTLIGGKSAGAIGTVRYWPLGDGTMLGITATVYETFKGESLNTIGVTPDITVARTTADILAGRDPQLDAALKHLESKAKTQP